MSTPAYVTAADLETLFSAEEIAQLTQSGPTSSAVLAIANGEVHAYLSGLLAGRTLAEIPPVLKGKAADIARMYLYKDTASEVVLKRWHEALRWLQAVAEGKFPLALTFVPTPEGEEPYQPDGWSLADPNTAAAADLSGL
jgi:phage gp36-like protein